MPTAKDLIERQPYYNPLTAMQDRAAVRQAVEWSMCGEPSTLRVKANRLLVILSMIEAETTDPEILGRIHIDLDEPRESAQDDDAGHDPENTNR